MKTNNQVLRRNFNLLGYVYNPLKRLFLANKPEKVIFKSLQNFECHSKVLVVGGGADNTLIELLKYPLINSVVHVDISSVLSKKSKLRLKKALPQDFKKANFEVSPFLSYQEEGFDAIIFPFYLDLFSDEEVAENVRHAKSKLNEKGRVYVIDFSSAESQTKWLKFKIWGLYKLFRPVSKVSRFSVPDYSQLFSIEGFKKVAAHTYYKEEYALSIFRL